MRVLVLGDIMTTSCRQAEAGNVIESVVSACNSHVVDQSHTTQSASEWTGAACNVVRAVR